MAIEKVRMTSTGVNAKGKPTGTFKVIFRDSRKDKLVKKMYDARAAFFDAAGKLLRIGGHVEFKQKGKLK